MQVYKWISTSSDVIEITHKKKNCDNHIDVFVIGFRKKRSIFPMDANLHDPFHHLAWDQWREGATQTGERWDLLRIISHCYSNDFINTEVAITLVNNQHQHLNNCNSTQWIANEWIRSEWRKCRPRSRKLVRSLLSGSAYSMRHRQKA
jgi:hypothetical protein